MSKIFQVFPNVKKEVWGGEFWEDGYFVRIVGDKLTKDLIKKYIKSHKHRKKRLNSWSYSEKPRLLRRGLFIWWIFCGLIYATVQHFFDQKKTLEKLE